MSHLEPEDPIEPNCYECGEEEDVEHVNGPMWKCNACGETFSDGSDSDGSEFDDRN